MKYRSIKSGRKLYTLADAVHKNLADDGSLLVPEKIPVLTAAELKSLKGASLQSVAELILKKYFSDSLSATEIKAIVSKAINFPIPLTQIGQVKIFELFHGPTKSYKDLPSRIFACLTEVLLNKEKIKPLKLLVGSSEYSGASIAHAFANLLDVETVCLFPKHIPNHVRSELLHHLGENATCVEVDGSPDTCHKLIDKAFNDPDLKKSNLMVANTINVGSLIPHVIYFAYLYAISKKNFQVVMSPGKFGKVTAALMAIKMGIPLGKVVLAVDNDDLNADLFMKTGSYRDQNHGFFDYFMSSKHVSVAYDFPRVAWLCNNSASEFAKHFSLVSVKSTQAADMLSTVFFDYGYVMEPRTAAAWVAQDTLDYIDHALPVVIADGSAVLFAKEIGQISEVSVDDGNFIASIKRQKLNNIYRPSSYADIKKLLQSNV